MTEIKGKAANNKKKQLMLIGVVATVVIGVSMLASVFTGAPAPVETVKAPEAKLISVPGGQGSEKTSWKVKESVRLEAQNSALNDQLNDLKRKLDEYKEQQKQKEAERLETERKEEERRKLEEAMPKQPVMKQAGNSSIPNPNINVPAGKNNGQFNQVGTLNEPLNNGVAGQLQMGVAPRGNGIVTISVFKPAEVNKDGKDLKPVSTVGRNSSQTKLGKPEVDDHSDETYMPAGSFVRVVMLSGLDAPTGGQSQNNPHPVLFRVLDPAQLPNMFKSDVTDCVITANGYGDLSAERVHIRTDRLSCIDEDGNSTDIKLTGYAAGEDGKEGMRGRLVTKQGQVIAKAMLAGLVDGIGTIVKQSSMTQTTVGGFGTTNTLDSSKVAQAGVGGAIGNAGTVLSKYYMNLANQLFPVLEVDAGRITDIVLSQGVYMGVKER